MSVHIIITQCKRDAWEDKFAYDSTYQALHFFSAYIQP